MSRLELNLSKEFWLMEGIRPGQGIKEGFHTLPCERQGSIFNWNYARIPGDVYTDLQLAGEIEDPYFGRNMHKAKWVQEKEWWYACYFNVPAEMQGKWVSLIFEGVDYSCDVWLNQKYLGAHQGMFSPFSFDIEEILSFEQWSAGANLLMLKLDPPPRNFEKVSGKKFNFSGDYHTGLVPLGIWRPVKIQAVEQCKIENLRIESTLCEDESAIIDYSFDIISRRSLQEKLQLDISILGHNCVAKKETDSLSIAETQRVCGKIKIASPSLWWPWDMGEQNLYRMEMELRYGNRLLDETSQIFGIREIQMERNPEVSVDDAEYPWTFIINKKRHFLRSACWGGQPSLLYGRNTTEKYEYLLHLVKDCNINNLRIFGWHPPEIKEFYDLCDELGITVWTNFTFSTQVVPQSMQEEIPSMVQECMEIVKERRLHPSAIFWMGGEEVFFTEAHAKSLNRKIMEKIGEAIPQYTNTPYALASPLSNEIGQMMGFKAKESRHANGHYYGAGIQFMEEYYPSLDCCIIPELTAASAPNIASLKKFIPANELWPMGMTWAYHWADIDILKILNFEVFGNEKTNSLEEFVEATQIAHGTILQFALEVYRRRKPRVSGVAFCHFITNWPDIKWGIIDYYGQKKKCFEFVQRTYQPLLISLEVSKRRWQVAELFSGNIWLVNDYQKGYSDCKILWEVFNIEGDSIKKESIYTNIEPDSAKLLEEISFTIPNNFDDYFSVKLEIQDKDRNLISHNEYVLLVAEQEEAKRHCLQMQKKSQEMFSQTQSRFFRYFPDKLKLD